MTEIPTIAPLKNVMLFNQMVDTVMNRPDHLPGMGIFFGPSGFGKTFSAQYAAHLHRAFYLEVGAFWSVTSFCDALLTQTGLGMSGTIAAKISVIIERLATENRPLIIDEFDHMVTNKKVDLVRDIHDKTGIAIIMIGEENLPSKLKRWERFHNRILQWVGAEASTLGDTVALSKIYCPDLKIDQDVLEALTKASGNRARRICTNLEQVRQTAKRSGLEHISADSIDFQWFTGAIPAGRRF